MGTLIFNAIQTRNYPIVRGGRAGRRLPLRGGQPARRHRLHLPGPPHPAGQDAEVEHGICDAADAAAGNARLDRIPVLGEVLERPLGALGFVIVAVFLLMVVFRPVHRALRLRRSRTCATCLQGPVPSTICSAPTTWAATCFRALIYGSRIALGTAVPAVASPSSAASCWACWPATSGGIVDDVIVVLLDSIQAFPGSHPGPGHPGAARAVARQRDPGHRPRLDSRLRPRDARPGAVGQAERSTWRPSARWAPAAPRIVLGHILPNVLAPLLILAAMDLPVVITFEAGLSFLGLGVRPPTPSWGVILSDGFKFIRNSPWPITWAGLRPGVTTLGFTLFGETLRDVLDPRLSGTRRA